MDGSEENEATLDDLLSLISGNADPAVKARVRVAMSDPSHPYSYFVRQPTGDTLFQERWPPEAVSESALGSLPSGTFSFPLKWRDKVQDLASGTLSLVDSLANSIGLMPLPHLSKGEGDDRNVDNPLDETLVTALENGEPIIANDVDTNRWIHVSYSQGNVMIRAGLSSSELFDTFDVIGHREGKSVLSLPSSDGVVVLTAADMETLANECDSMVIQPR